MPNTIETFLRRRYATSPGRQQRAPRDLKNLTSMLCGRPLLIELQTLEAVGAVLGRAKAGRGLGETELIETLAKARAAHGELKDPKAEVFDGPRVRGGSAPIVDGVAVVAVDGVLVKHDSELNASLGFVSTERLGAEFEAAVADPAVSSVLFHVDSGGGQADGTFQLADMIRARRGVKPIGAFLDGMAASAAYAIACAVDPGRVTLYRTSLAGSIGTYIVRSDWTKYNAERGLERHVVRAHDAKYKAAENPDRPFDDDSMEAMRALVDPLNDVFLDHVAACRGLDRDAVRQFDAALFVGQEAVDAGLADGLGTLAQAIGSLRDAAGPSGGTDASTDASAAAARNQDHSTTTHTTPAPEGAQQKGDTMPKTGTKPLGQTDDAEDEETTSTTDDEATTENEGEETTSETDDEATSRIRRQELSRIRGIEQFADDMDVPRSHQVVKAALNDGLSQAKAQREIAKVAKDIRNRANAANSSLSGVPGGVNASLGGDGAGGREQAASYHEARSAALTALRSELGREPSKQEVYQRVRGENPKLLRGYITSKTVRPPQSALDALTTV